MERRVKPMQALARLIETCVRLARQAPVRTVAAMSR